MSRAKKGGTGGGRALDDLMMAYADLNAPTKNQGFKGPPVKDIKRETKSVSYTPSSKARNWRTLDQSLESAFSHDSTTTLQQPLSASVNPVGDIGSFFQPNQPVSGFPTSAASIVSSKDDEWGDFQDFASAPASFSANPPTQPLSTIQPSPMLAAATTPNLATLHPLATAAPASFSTTASSFSSEPFCSTPAAAAAPMQAQTPLHFQFSSTSASASAATFNPTPPLPLNQQVNQQGNMSANQLASDISSLVLNSNTNQVPRESVGCRLASFQQESPVHRFKAAAPKEEEVQDDFGDFASFEIAAPVSTLPTKPTLDAAIVVRKSPQPPSITTVMPIGLSALLKPTVPPPSVQDKYSALRDVLAADDSTSSLTPAPPDESLNTSADNLIVRSPAAASLFSPNGGGCLDPSAVVGGSGPSPLLVPSPSAANTSSEMLLSSPFNSCSGNGSGGANYADKTSPSSATNGNFWSLPSQQLPLKNAKASDHWDAADDFGEFVEPPSSVPAASSSDGSSLPPLTSYGLLPPLSSGIAPQKNSGYPQSIPSLFPPLPSPASFPSTAAAAAVSSDPANDEEFDEWSLPAKAVNESTMDQISTTSMSRRVRAFGGLKAPADAIHDQGATSLPFFSSSPPRDTSSPPPLSATPSGGMGLEFELPSEQLQLSDQDLFGTASEKKTGRAGQGSPPTPTSLHDLIHQKRQTKDPQGSVLPHSTEEIELAGNTEPGDNVSKIPRCNDLRESIDDVFIPSAGDRPDDSLPASDLQWETDTVLAPTPHDAASAGEEAKVGDQDRKIGATTPTTSAPVTTTTSGLRPPSVSPESVSIASLEFETDHKSSIECVGLVSQWTEATLRILQLIQTVTATYRNLETADGVKEEVLASERGRDLLHNLREVYLVFCRINHAIKALSIVDEELERISGSIAKTWEELKLAADKPAILSQLIVDILPANDNDLDVCGICLTTLADFGASIVNTADTVAGPVNLNVGVVEVNGCEYHASCANFWINVVDCQIPNLKIPKSELARVM